MIQELIINERNPKYSNWCVINYLNWRNPLFFSSADRRSSAELKVLLIAQSSSGHRPVISNRFSSQTTCWIVLIIQSQMPYGLWPQSNGAGILKICLYSTVEGRFFKTSTWFSFKTTCWIILIFLSQMPMDFGHKVMELGWPRVKANTARLFDNLIFTLR